MNTTLSIFKRFLFGFLGAAFLSCFFFFKYPMSFGHIGSRNLSLVGIFRFLMPSLFSPHVKNTVGKIYNNRIDALAHRSIFDNRIMITSDT